MSFSQSSITSVNPPVESGGSLLISWEASLPPGQVFQIYVNGDLAGHTSQLRFHIPIPTETVQIAIGTVPMADAGTSFSPAIPPQPRARVEIAWEGGRFESPSDGDVAGFRVYGETTPGGGIDYATVLADIPVAIGGIFTDGFGLGGFGTGGFGFTAGNYQWTSGVLASGTYAFAVRAYDAAGNESDPQTVSQTVSVPPQEPPPFDDGTRLHYSIVGYSDTGFGTGGYGLPEVTLTWLPSPG